MGPATCRFLTMRRTRKSCVSQSRTNSAGTPMSRQSTSSTSSTTCWPVDTASARTSAHCSPTGPTDANGAADGDFAASHGLSQRSVMLPLTSDRI